VRLSKLVYKHFHWPGAGFTQNLHKVCCDSSGMKRTLLIFGGTLGGLGAVVAITPPQITSIPSMGGSTAVGVPAVQVHNAVPAPVAVAPTPTSAPVTQAPATVFIKQVTHREDDENEYEDYEDDGMAAAPRIQKSVPVAPVAPVQSATPAPVATATKKATPAAPSPVQSTKSVSGTFTGSAVNVSYGMVQVKITVANGKITDAQAIQAPNGRSDRWTQMSVPVLRQQTLAAQSANINGASGASYTSAGWHTSLVSALNQAGL
jgi:uncharacterized protein with FMN-binding domain